MKRTGYASIVQAQTTGDSDVALSAIAWQARRTTVGDLLYQALRSVTYPAIAVIDCGSGMLYFTTDETTGDALKLCVPDNHNSVTYKPVAGQTGIALRWEIVGDDEFGLNTTEITSGQRRSLGTLINWALNSLNQSLTPLVVVDQRDGKVRFAARLGTESADLDAVTKAGETFTFLFRDRTTSYLVFEGGQSFVLNLLDKKASEYLAAGGVRVNGDTGRLQMKSPDNDLWYDFVIRMADGAAGPGTVPTLNLEGEGEA